jgi:hypothetical protein
MQHPLVAFGAAALLPKKHSTHSGQALAFFQPIINHHDSLLSSV